MTPQERKVMEQALEALELSSVTVDSFGGQRKTQEAITALRAAIAEAEKQEPAVVTYQEVYEGMDFLWRGTSKQMAIAKELSNKPLYPAPPKREWVGLTDEEIILMSGYDLEHAALIGEVQRKLKEKNT